MRKIFLFIAALCVSIAVNARVTQIDNSKANALQDALSKAATTGDTILMAKGTYAESGNYLAFTGKEITVCAAKGDTVIIRTVCPVRLKEGAKAEFINIMFDCSTIGGYDYVIVPADDTDNKRVVLTSCEFYGWDKNKAMIEATSSRRLASVTIDSCYFHNCHKSVVFIENTGSINLRITNSTFANITTDASSFSAGVIDCRATSGSMLVDHCTFYNVLAMSTDYAAVGKVATPGAVVSNCIFAMPTSTAELRAIRDVSAANNCLTYNYTKDSNRGIHDDVAKNNCIYGQDPKFTDAASGNFLLAADSPAKEAGVGKSHLGAPKWWNPAWEVAAEIPVSDIVLDADELALDVNETGFLHATVSPNDATDPSVTWTSSDPTVASVNGGVVKALKSGTTTITATAGAFSDECEVTVSDNIPSTNFASPYFLEGTKAKLAGNIYVSEADSLHYKDKSVAGTATWNLHADATGFIRATINFKAGSESGAKFNIKIYDSEDDLVGEDSLGYWEHDGDKDMPHTLCIPAIDDYTIVLSNNESWSSAKINGVTLTYVSTLPTVAAKGDWDSWAAELPLTLAKDGKTASVNVPLSKGTNCGFKMVIGGNLRSNEYWFKREGPTSASGIEANWNNNMVICADWTGNYTITWTFETNAIEISFPEIPNITLYFVNESDWSGVFAYAWKGDNKNAEWPGVIADLTELQCKGHDVYSYTYSADKEYEYIIFNRGVGGEGNQTDNLPIDSDKPYYYNNDWHATLDCTATAIDNTEVTKSAQKLLENGQIVIIKNGVRYSVLGQIK